MAEQLSINQRVAEYAAKRLDDFTKECTDEVAAFLKRAETHNLHEAMAWNGDDALAAEKAGGRLHDVREAMGEIHRGDYDSKAIRVLDRYRSATEELLLHGPDPLAMSSGGPCRMAAHLSEIAGLRRAYQALKTVYREVRSKDAELHSRQ